MRNAVQPPRRGEAARPEEAPMFATSIAQARLHAEAAANTPDVVLTDGLEGEIEAALAEGWHPHLRRHRQGRMHCSLLHRRPRDDDRLYRP